MHSSSRQSNPFVSPPPPPIRTSIPESPISAQRGAERSSTPKRSKATSPFRDSQSKAPLDRELLASLLLFFKTISQTWKLVCADASMPESTPLSWLFVYHAQALHTRRWYSQSDLRFQTECCARCMPHFPAKALPHAQSLLGFLEDHLAFDPQSVLVGHIPSTALLCSIGLGATVPLDNAVFDSEDLTFPVIDFNCDFPCLSQSSSAAEPPKKGALVLYRVTYQVDKWDQHLTLDNLRFARYLGASSHLPNHAVISLSALPTAPNAELVVSTSQLYQLSPSTYAILTADASPHVLKDLVFESLRYFYATVNSVSLTRLLRILNHPSLDPQLLQLLLTDKMVLHHYFALRQTASFLNLIQSCLDPSAPGLSVQPIPFFPEDTTREIKLPATHDDAKAIAQRFVLADLQFLSMTKHAIVLLEKEPMLINHAPLSRQVTMNNIGSRSVSKAFKHLVELASQYLSNFESIFRTFHTGESFKNLRTWWLDYVRNVTATYLSEIGFDMSPLSDRSIEPTTHRAAIAKDLSLLDQLLAPQEDNFALVPFVCKIITSAYLNIDEFIEKGFIILSIALNRHVDDIKHLDGAGETYLRQLEPPFKWIRGVREDLEFLLVMKAADTAYLESTNPKTLSKPAGTIPLYSIIVDRFVRYRQELLVL